MYQADVLKNIAVTFAYTTIHPDDVEKFFNQYVELNFPTHRHSKTWALAILKKEYENAISNINKMNKETS